MTAVLSIAAAEWRYWRRSRLALVVVALFVLTLAFVSVLTNMRVAADAEARAHHQEESEETFLSQPDRHPHRMVHYGHYVFRTPTPLATFDPGLDSVTGQAMFLEGHRQNSATFSSSVSSADLGGLSWLTPAVIYQVFAPLLIVILGYGAIVREREARTLAPLLAQGTSAGALISGKLLALFSFALLLVVPLAVTALRSTSDGESASVAASLVALYLLYLCVWIGLTVLVSTVLQKRTTVLATLAACWLTVTLALPAIAVNATSRAEPLAGKIETELTMLNEVRDLGDGHDVDDSVYDALQASLLEEEGVERVEDLDVNIRGVLAGRSEAELTETLNEYAERRMQAESRQARVLNRIGWLTPTLALGAASRAIVGTDLEHYHRFLRQAEALRIEFVQGLNRVHAEELSYTADINRNRDEASSRRARVDASNWEVLETFEYEPAPASERLARASSSLQMLIAWLIALAASLSWAGMRLKP
ncbi:MAG: DUF3526 domain-containing protein [Pseudomonadota bacterium]